MGEISVDEIFKYYVRDNRGAGWICPHCSIFIGVTMGRAGFKKFRKHLENCKNSFKNL